MPFVLSTGKDLLFLLILQVGLAASLAALLARSATFRKVLYTELRDSDEKLRLMLFLTPPLAIGVMLRLVNYPFADLMLEWSFLLGLLGGRVVGPLGGAIISLPAFFNLEWLSTPVAAAAGLAGGMIRHFLPNKESVWNLGPFTFLSLPRWVVGMALGRRSVWEMVPLGACVALELGRIGLGRTVPPRWLFVMNAGDAAAAALLVISTVMAVAVPLKIWNNTRIEGKLEQHQQLLLRARMDALSSQINPHFLFNTLNAVSSLIRYDPDLARVVVVKLSNILRRLLRKQENFVTLREELSFVDDYLDIEVARFGRDKLHIAKDVDGAALESFVPSMLLQPIIENSIRHGLAPKLEGGEIRVRARLGDGRLHIEVEDNGIGIPAEKISKTLSGVEGSPGLAEGIGISNVHERLKVLYGEDFRLDIESQPGQGTRIHIEVPELVTALEPSP